MRLLPTLVALSALLGVASAEKDGDNGGSDQSSSTTSTTSSSATNSTSSSGLSGSKTCNSHLCIQTVLDPSTSTLTYTLTSSGSPSGWYGIGTGSQMAGSTMWVVWSSSGNVYWSERDGQGHNAPNVVSSTTATYLTAQSTSNSSGLQATWTTPYSGSASSSYPLIWGYSGSTPSSSSSASIQQHSSYGNFLMDLTSTVSANGTVSASTSSGMQTYETLIKVHAILMAVGWGILAPFAVLLARYGRATTFKWVAAHQWIQIIGTTGLTLAGFGVAVAAVASAHESQFRGGHQKLGLAITILIFLQLVGGWWIHHKYDAKRTHRPIRNWMHMVIGMGFLVAGFIAIYTGIDTWDEGSTWMRVLFWIWLAILVVVLIVGYAIIPRQRRREAAKKEQAMGMSNMSGGIENRYPTSSYGPPPTQYAPYQPPAGAPPYAAPHYPGTGASPISSYASDSSVGPRLKPATYGRY